MRRRFIPTALALTALLTLSSCAGPDAASSTPNTVINTQNTTESQSGEFVDDSTTTSTESVDKILKLIKPEQAKEMLDSDLEILLLDVRTQAEYDELHIPGSTLIPVEELTGRLGEIEGWQNNTVIVYCRSGRRSAIAAKTLAEAGFSTIYDLGGIQNWPYETE